MILGMPFALANSTVEDDPKLNRIFLRMDFFNAFASGFLEETHSFLTNIELCTLAFAPKVMTFIIGLRFLTDFIQGDNYYKIKYNNHNLIRARAQFKLLESMEKNFDSMKESIEQKIGNKN